MPGPHWDDAAPRLADYLKSKSLDDSRANRLRWMLEHTLGCPGTFEFRRAELKKLRNEDDVTDDDVVDSCVGEVLPGGALRAYLERASVAARFGSTLFVHGAVDAQTAGFVPDKNTRFRVGRHGDAGFPPTKSFMGERDVDAWVRDLNALLAWGLEDHLARPTFAAGSGAANASSRCRTAAPSGADPSCPTARRRRQRRLKIRDDAARADLGRGPRGRVDGRLRRARVRGVDQIHVGR